MLYLKLLIILIVKCRFHKIVTIYYSQLVEEINEFDKEKSEDERKVASYKKTSMKEYMLVFDNFLNQLSKENVERRRDESGKFYFEIFEVLV